VAAAPSRALRRVRLISEPATVLSVLVMIFRSRWA
jgi:hypothetical protein